MGSNRAEPEIAEPIVPAPAAPRTPIARLAAAGACVIAAFWLAAVSGQRPVLSVLGWLAGGPIALALLAHHTEIDVWRRTEPRYRVRRGVGTARVALILLALPAAGFNAWRFADWVSIP